MAKIAAPSLKPRKQPVQHRSGVTVEVIYEATIQVLLAVGFSKLTTTRVAERAGVSVGTLYQYFPNKHSLLAAVSQQYLDAISNAVEEACTRHKGQSLEATARGLCDAFVDAKLRRPDISVALHLPGSEIHKEDLIKEAMARLHVVVADALHAVSDQPPQNPMLASFILMTAVMGPVQAVLDQGAPAEMVEMLKTQLFELSYGYLLRSARP